MHSSEDVIVQNLLSKKAGGGDASQTAGGEPAGVGRGFGGAGEEGLGEF